MTHCGIANELLSISDGAVLWRSGLRSLMLAGAGLNWGQIWVEGISIFCSKIVSQSSSRLGESRRGAPRCLGDPPPPSHARTGDYLPATDLRLAGLPPDPDQRRRVVAFHAVEAHPRRFRPMVGMEIDVEGADQDE